MEEELSNCTHVLKALIWNSNSGFGCFCLVCEHKKNLKKKKKKKKKMKMRYGICEILILGFYDKLDCYFGSSGSKGGERHKRLLKGHFYPYFLMVKGRGGLRLSNGGHLRWVK